MKLRFSLGLAVLLLAGATRAEPPSADATIQARSHFQSGLERAQQGDLPAALREFEAAYAIRPHFSVLYNIGQTRSTLGHPVEAVSAFERYLSDGGSQVAPERRSEVEALLTANRARIGRLHLLLDAGTQARVWLDGTELTRDALRAPMPIAVGTHTVVYSNGAGFPESRSITVTKDDVAELALVIPPPPENGVAQLAVHCGVPGVDVEIDGAHRGTTPLAAPLLVPSGTLNIRFSRSGYVASGQTLTIHNGELHLVRCEQRAVRPLPPTLAARLTVRALPNDAEIRVDGEIYAAEPLPAGPHRLRVERDGFIAQEKTLSLQAGRLTLYDATLAPTPATREREHHALARRKTLGIVLASVGAALIATGAGVYAWNSGRYDDWRSKQAAGSASHLSLATSIQRGDDAVVGLFAVGGGLAIGGGWEFFDSRANSTN